MACECFTRVLAPETDEHIVLFRRGGHVLISYHNQLHLTRKKNLQNTSEENRTGYINNISISTYSYRTETPYNFKVNATLVSFSF